MQWPKFGYSTNLNNNGYKAYKEMGHSGAMLPSVHTPDLVVTTLVSAQCPYSRPCGYHAGLCPVSILQTLWLPRWSLPSVHTPDLVVTTLVSAQCPYSRPCGYHAGLCPVSILQTLWLPRWSLPSVHTPDLVVTALVSAQCPYSRPCGYHAGLCPVSMSDLITQVLSLIHANNFA